jgi:hypothetical protein
MKQALTLAIAWLGIPLGFALFSHIDFYLQSRHGFDRQGMWLFLAALIFVAGGIAVLWRIDWPQPRKLISAVGYAVAMFLVLTVVLDAVACHDGVGECGP